MNIEIIRNTLYKVALFYHCFCWCDLFMDRNQSFAVFSLTLSPSTTSVWTLAVRLQTSCARFSPLRRTGGTNTDFQTWRYSLWNLPNPGRSSSRSTPSGPSWPRTTERSSTQPVEDSSLTASRLLPGLMTTTRWISHPVLFCSRTIIVLIWSDTCSCEGEAGGGVLQRVQAVLRGRRHQPWREDPGGQVLRGGGWHRLELKSECSHTWYYEI